MSIVTDYGTVQVQIVRKPYSEMWDVIDVDTNQTIAQLATSGHARDLAVYVNDLVAELEGTIEDREQELRDYKRAVEKVVADLDRLIN